MPDVLLQLPIEKRRTLEATVEGLKAVRNVAALVLGGSCARGFARPSSDLDIGIYYREAAPPAVEDVRAVAQGICTPGSAPVVTELYGWGPWVNGGAWIETPATRVDFIYRNLDQVWRVIEEGRRGVWQHHYDQQPPYGFRSVVYFAETQYCVALHDPAGEVSELKKAVAGYPEGLRARILEDCLWGAEFSLWSCDGFVAAGDVCNVTACLVRASHYLIQGIFALNGEYFLNDKHTNRILAELTRRPNDCVARLSDILSRPGRTVEEMQSAVAAFRRLWWETVELADGAYRPRFRLPGAAVL
ncbi:MAG: nucleotidyltransferase domain-containing protein [Bryobacteraceae bacterium]|nr:nucleotidyltransferase domain-containing protein [Bryobacteraceae bacterium]